MASPGPSRSHQDNVADRLAFRAIENPDQEDEDSLFDELEKDDELAGYREQRLEALKKQMAELGEMKAKDHGQYTEILDEKSAIKLMTSTELCVLHFYHPEFRRCMIIDKHLKTLSAKYFTTKFFKINVANAPFLVTKLKIQILPCVIPIVDAIAGRRLVGFEDLGNHDDFKTAELETFLLNTGVLRNPRPPKSDMKGRDSDDENHSSDEDYMEDDTQRSSTRQRHNNGFIGSASSRSSKQRGVAGSDGEDGDEFA
ncbi:hypothetical protein H4R33_003252 [Dimargaris cristalligena]|nr:hypothetical protein H4R33_003252 [Dimargaris cristalligena]